MPNNFEVIKSFILRLLLKTLIKLCLKALFLRLSKYSRNKTAYKHNYQGFFCIKNSVQKWVKSINWHKNSISPFFYLIFLLLPHYYKTIRTDFSTLKNCQKTHLKTAYHRSMSGKQQKIKCFLLLLKSM